MALTYDQLSGITERKFIPKLVDNVFDSDVLLQRAKKKGYYEKIDGGLSIMQPLGYAQLSASGWYDGAESLDTSDNETMTSAEYHWRQGYANITITRKDELKNSGDAGKIKLVKAKTQLAEKTLTDILQSAIYNSGTDVKAPVGLGSIIGTANTVGGISQSQNSWWAAQVDGTTTTLTLGAMQTLHNSCSINQESPTIGIGTRAMYNRYYALLQPQQRFMDKEVANGGFSSLMFNGMPIVVGSKVPANNLLFINENYFHIYCHKEEDMRFEPFQKPTNQNVKTAKIYWMGSIGSSNNRMHGKLSAVTA
jgi:hypothetical protein